MCVAGLGKNQSALPSARDLALGKVKVCRVPDSKHSALFFFNFHYDPILCSGAGSTNLPSVPYMTLDKYYFRRVSGRIHSAK